MTQKKDVVDLLLEQHGQIKDLFNRVAAAQGAEKRELLVIQHATREESEEFPRLREKVPAEQLQRMTGAVQAAQATAPTRPHPMAGESAMANLLAGPPLAVFDRVRDRVRDWRESNRGG